MSLFFSRLALSPLFFFLSISFLNVACWPWDVIITSLSNNQLFRLAEHPLDVRIPRSGLIYYTSVSADPPFRIGALLTLFFFFFFFSVSTNSLSMREGEDEGKQKQM